MLYQRYNCKSVRSGEYSYLNFIGFCRHGFCTRLTGSERYINDISIIRNIIKGNRMNIGNQFSVHKPAVNRIRATVDRCGSEGYAFTIMHFSICRIGNYRDINRKCCRRLVNGNIFFRPTAVFIHHGNRVISGN